MRRIAELDALRGIAALAIVVYHLWFIGQISYCLYLYHHIVFFAVEGLAPTWWGRAGTDFLRLSMSFGLATVSWLLVEKPILALKGRFAYSRDVTKPRPHVAATRGLEVPQWST